MLALTHLLTARKHRPSRPDSVALHPLTTATVVEAMSDQVISTFLVGLRHDQLEQLLRRADPVSNRV